MRIEPLRQTCLIDVAEWEQDAEFGIYPQGARAKDAVFVPETPPDAVLVPNKRYMFKRSNKKYPDQWWGEVVAYRVGCLMGLEVPPAFVSWNSTTGICAALIEWFSIDGQEVSTLAGDFLQQRHPDFDREKGTQHNLQHVITLLRSLVQGKVLISDHWHQWWTDALLFDALIGNTDRHQDNWGFIFKTKPETGPQARLMPLFDNGTSLGHERFPDRVATWKEADYTRYIHKGKHHIAWSLDEPRIKGHRELLIRVLEAWPETREMAKARLAAVTEHSLLDVLSDLAHIPAPVALSQPRFDFILKLLKSRTHYLKEVLS